MSVSWREQCAGAMQYLGYSTGDGIVDFSEDLYSRLLLQSRLAGEGTKIEQSPNGWRAVNPGGQTCTKDTPVEAMVWAAYMYNLVDSKYQQGEQETT